MSDLPDPATFPLQAARELAMPLVEPRQAIYWVDFLFHAALGWGVFALAVAAAPFSLAQAAAVVVAAFALYRAVIFIHELAHLRRDRFRVFRLVWNVLVGIPMQVPSFTYAGVHSDHHQRGIYGTREDGEYVPFAIGPRRKIVLYLLLIFVLPVAVVLRFAVLTPLSYFLPPLRRLLWERASSLTIDFAYRRPPPARRDDKTWRMQEFLAFVFSAAVIGLIAAGRLPLAILGVWYAVVLLIFLFNSLRTLAAHAYRNPGDRPMSAAEEFLDSVNVPGSRLWTTLWAPVGLRYHATHHLFPALPYHALGKAHRLLIERLPDNRLYLAASRRSLWDALRRLWREAGAARRAGAPG